MAHIAVKLNGQRWKLKRPVRLTLGGDVCDGRCDYHDRVIHIRKDLRGLPELETILHEAHHAQAEIVNEEFVDRTADETATILWTLGYRKLSAEQIRTLGLE